MIDAAKIEELRGLLAKATPGPWSTHLVDDTTIISPTREVATTCDSVQAEREDGYNIEYEQMEADAALIVAMRSALPALLDLATASLANGGEDAELCVALTSYQQADEDGVMVLVSRQACDEAATRLRALALARKSHPTPTR